MLVNVQLKKMLYLEFINITLVRSIQTEITMHCTLVLKPIRLIVFTEATLCKESNQMRNEYTCGP